MRELVNAVFTRVRDEHKTGTLPAGLIRKYCGSYPEVTHTQRLLSPIADGPGSHPLHASTELHKENSGKRIASLADTSEQDAYCRASTMSSEPLPAGWPRTISLRIPFLIT